MTNTFIKKLILSNILSFGGTSNVIELQNINLLIGVNGSGKSNLIEIISLLQSSAKDLVSVIRKGGGVNEWIWKGNKKENSAKVETFLECPFMRNAQFLRYYFEFVSVSQRFELIDEIIENSEPNPGESRPYFYYKYDNNHPVINVNKKHRKLQKEGVNPEQSIISQRKDPESFPEITWLSDSFQKIKIYREWTFGRNSHLRIPQLVDAPNDFLLEDCSNLGLVLNKLKQNVNTKRKILKLLKSFYSGIEDYGINIEGGSVQLFIQEGDLSIPITRLSDGTLRFLCLLAILCHPTPPPLVCIEEPELGLHNDVIPELANLLKEFAERSQLIITTHSSVLVDEFTDNPESVLVCEKQENKTSLNRLNKKELEDWLKNYNLGDLWIRGEIGGNRW